ncbi:MULTISPECIES: hypothetical protein [unclassified Pseudomonas]|uniref:hypothetical protein n=1 Tax=unclassified Pseudomonas TaxID=196821 RepID=UPI0038006227
MRTSHFRHIPRRNRARGLTSKLKLHSTRFKLALAEENIEKQSKESIAAWETMVKLFEILRGEQDLGNLASEPMEAGTGYLVICDSIDEQLAMMEQKKLTALGLQLSVSAMPLIRLPTGRIRLFVSMEEALITYYKVAIKLKPNGWLKST